MHLNGGENYSSRIDGNDEYNLRVKTHTNGSPDYRITSKTLGVDDAPEIELDLMAKDRDLQGFCDAYNSRANAIVVAPATLEPESKNDVVAG
jgi:hypothetical protein